MCHPLWIKVISLRDVGDSSVTLCNYDDERQLLMAGLRCRYLGRKFAGLIMSNGDQIWGSGVVDYSLENMVYSGSICVSKWYIAGKNVRNVNVTQEIPKIVLIFVSWMCFCVIYSEVQSCRL